MDTNPLSVSDALALINQTLEYAYPSIVIEGEVASYKINQNKYVFFDIKDDQATLNCFMMLYQQRTPIEDGMKIRLVASPKLTQWGRFSLTVREIQPIGEGSLKRSLQLLLNKLDKEGLFDPKRKRSLPSMPKRIAVISSTQAAGYADFIKILNRRWGGVEVIVAHTRVQGAQASAQIERALNYLNERAELPEVIAIIRGGGSQDDLSTFNDEPLARAIASSRVPVITGIGHETDTTIADMVADVRATTPSDVAMIIVPDREQVLSGVHSQVSRIAQILARSVTGQKNDISASLSRSLERIENRIEQTRRHFDYQQSVLSQLNPRSALRRGYSLLYNEEGSLVRSVKTGDKIRIETDQQVIRAGVESVTKKQ